MKWLLAVVVFCGVVASCAAVMFVIGCFSVPSLDEGSHGMAVPLLLGYLGFTYGMPVGFIAAIVWLIVRSGKKKEEAESIRRAIDESHVDPDIASDEKKA